MTDTAASSTASHHEGAPRHGKGGKGSRPTAIATTTSDTARDLARRASAGIEANPLGVLVGGVALGVLAGAFVPRSERETRLLGPVGKRLTDTARGAVDAAKETARSEFDVLGLTRTAARGQANRLLEGVLGAVASAGAAALASQRKKAEAAKVEAPQAEVDGTGAE